MTESLVVGRFRIAAAVVAAALAVTGLAGCRSNVGSAAVVNGARISESDVNDYVTTAGVDAAVAAQAAQANPPQTIVPKQQALQILITEQVFAHTLSKNGGVPAAGALQNEHDAAARALGQSQDGTTRVGTVYDSYLRSSLGRVGLSASLLPHYLRLQELEYTLITRLKLQAEAQLVAAIRKAGTTVSVSPRYGTWDPAMISLTGAGTPSFLTISTASSAAAGSTG